MNRILAKLYHRARPFPAYLVDIAGPSCPDDMRRGQRWLHVGFGFWVGPEGQGPVRWPLNVGGKGLLLGEPESEFRMRAWCADNGRTWPEGGTLWTTKNM